MQIGITERGDAALDIGWLLWIKDNKPAILITKDPEKLHSRLHGYNVEHTANIIVHCTITGFGGTILEPNVPKPRIALEGAKILADKIGQDRVVLRIDPIIPTEKGIKKAEKVLLAAKGMFRRIRISFLDNYPHVKKRFEEAGLPSLPYSFHAPLIQRQNVLNYLQLLSDPTIEVCGEPGMECTGCISLKDTMELLSGTTLNLTEGIQRKACKCLAIKKELLNHKGQCGHNCLYCYWK